MAQAETWRLEPDPDVWKEHNQNYWQMSPDEDAKRGMEREEARLAYSRSLDEIVAEAEDCSARVGSDLGPYDNSFSAGSGVFTIVWNGIEFNLNVDGEYRESQNSTFLEMEYSPNPDVVPDRFDTEEFSLYQTVALEGKRNYMEVEKNLESRGLELLT